MPDLREHLERESFRVSLEPGAADRMFERRERRDRRRRVGTTVVGLALLVAVIALVLLALPRGKEPRPASPPSIVGSFTAQLPNQDPDVQRLGLKGAYQLRLAEGGTLEIIGPRRMLLPGPPITYSVTGDRFVTDLFVGEGCDAEGTYRWTLDGVDLRLTPVADACEMRSVLLSDRPWVHATTQPSADVLQGDWITTFTCEEMVRTVEGANVNSQLEKFWRRVQANELASDDQTDPCAGNPPSLTHTFRFDDGRLLLFDAPAGQEGFDGGYEVRGDVLTIRDATSNNIVGTYRVAYRLDGDRLTFDLLGRGGKDPFFVAVWETGEFRRA